MTVLTETIHQGEYLISEANGFRSREAVTVTVVGTDPYLSGTLLGKITATGKYIKYLNGAVDGSQAVAAILWNELPGVAGDAKATVHVRDCEVMGAKLTGSDANGLVDMAALGIIVR